MSDEESGSEGSTGGPLPGRTLSFERVWSSSASRNLGTPTVGPSPGRSTLGPPKPRIGGGSPDGTPWVGGNPNKPNKLPMHPTCYRPVKWKESMKIAETYCSGLKTVLEIGEGAKTTVVTFLHCWDAHLKKT